MKNIAYIVTALILFSCLKENKAMHPMAPEETERIIPPVSITPIDSIPEKLLTIERKYDFEDFRVEIYDGPLASPNFQDNPFADDKEYIEFITKGCNTNKINFGGHYTIIVRGCGAECLHIFIVERITGKIFTNIRPDEGRYGFAYRKNSTLLIANSYLFPDDTFEKYHAYWCEPEFYQWEKDNFILLE